MGAGDKYGSLWTREETILAFDLYCRIPFARATQKDPEVLKLAGRLGRTPASVARKLGNLGSFDERLAQRGVSGLTHASRLDAAIWNEFHGHWDRLVGEVTLILEEEGEAETPPLNPLMPPSETEALALRRERRGQRFFRDTVIASYRSRCCFCRIDLTDLLNASHIIPWSERVDTRLDPQNGLSLCALHDRAFDTGLVTVSPDYHIRVSSRILKRPPGFVHTAVSEFDGREIEAPTRFRPRPELLEWHGAHRFQP